MMTPDVEVTESVPQGSQALSDGIKKLVVAVVKNHQAGLGAVGEVSADVAEAVKDLGPALASIGLIGDELKAEPLGVAEAFAIAGFGAARELTGK